MRLIGVRRRAWPIAVRQGSFAERFGQVKKGAEPTVHQHDEDDRWNSLDQMLWTVYHRPNGAAPRTHDCENCKLRRCYSMARVRQTPTYINFHKLSVSLTQPSAPIVHQFPLIWAAISCTACTITPTTLSTKCLTILL